MTLPMLMVFLGACSSDDNPSPSGVEPLEISDAFDGGSLDAEWQVVNGSQFNMSVSDGRLHIQPTRNCVWYHADTGPLLYKLVEGNFMVTSTVRARKASNPSEPVGPSYQFGGLMARNPSSSAENYVFNVVGERGGNLSVETKTTVNGSSNVKGPPWPSGDAELRICRVDTEFILYKREIGDSSWTEAIRYPRGDMPSTVQVGPIAYTYTDNPDLRASFEQVDFAPVTSEADFTR